MARNNTVEIILAARDKASKITQKAFDNVQTTAKNAMGTVARAGALATAALATASGVVNKIGLDYNAMKEQSQIAWETILGSAEEAKTTLQDIQRLGATTPFEFEGLDKASKLLTMAKLGGDQLETSLTAVGDAVSAIGGNQETLEGVSMALFQMQAKGKVQAEEMLQLAERGLPVWDILAQKMGKSTKELMEMSSNGELMAKETVPLLVEGLSDRFGGAMQKQSKTWNGMWSTIRDNAKITAGVLTEGLFERVKGYLPVIINGFDRFNQALQSGGWKGVLDEFLPESTVNTIITGIEKVKSIFKTITTTIKENKDEIMAVVSGIVSFFQQRWNFLKSLFTGEGNIGQSLAVMFQTAKAIVMPVITDLINFVQQQFAKIKTFWDQNGAQIIAAIQNFWAIVSGIFKVLAPVILFIVKTIFANIKGAIEGVLNVILGLIKVFAGLFTGDFSKMWEGIKQVFLGAVQAVWNIVNLLLIGKVLGGIKALGTKAIGSFKSFWTRAVEIFKNLDTHVWNIIKSLTSKVTGGISSFVTSVVSKFNTMRAFGGKIFSSLWQAIRSTVGNIVSGVKNRFSGMVSGVKNYFSGLLSSARSRFNAIKNAITSPIQTAKNTIRNLISSIKGFFSNMRVNIPLPHFSAGLNYKNIAGVKIPVPDIDVDWYDKGGIFTGPQVIGVGEKRPEFVGALDDLKAIVREVMQENNQGGSAIVKAVVNVSGMFTGNQHEFKRFVQQEIIPLLNEEVARIVLKNIKV